MLPQPRFQRCGLAVGQHINALTGDRVDQDGGITPASTRREVIHPEHAGHPALGQRQAQQGPQGGVPGHDHRQARHPGPASQMTHHRTDLGDQPGLRSVARPWQVACMWEAVELGV